MGYSLRTDEWRYSTFCAWDGPRLAPDWSRCAHEELFDHRNDSALWDVDHVENANLAGAPALAATQALLHALLLASFGGPTRAGA